LQNLWRRLWRILPAILAFSLLAVQIAIPWTVPHFVTQDGPSHLYTAVVAKNLLFHAQPYASLYRMNRHLVPSWATTILLALSASVAGTGHAEQLMTSLILCLGFFSFSYAIRSLSPTALRWTPLSNFLLETWFLWMGFYNFYLGIVLAPFAIGFYIRRGGKLTTRAAITLAFAMALLFFVHLLAAAVSLLVLGIIALWLHVVGPALWTKSPDWRESGRQVGIFAGAMLPVVVLGLIFARQAPSGMTFHPNVLQSLSEFPMHVFATANGLAGGQWYLFPVVLGLIVIAVLGMRRSEWHTAKGGLGVAAVALFFAYLLVPDSGLGGNEVKVRFAWVVFLLGGLLVSSAARLQPLGTPIAIFLTACLAFNLAVTGQSLVDYSDAVEDYLSALAGIRPGSTIVRLRYPTPDLSQRYGFGEIGRDPLFHLDAYAASRLGCIDLTDYQAPTTDFPVIFNSKLDHEKQFKLLEFENPSDDEGAVLNSLRKDLPMPIDYVIVVADGSSPTAPVAKVIASLDSGMQLIAQSPGPVFVRVYQRTAAR
jgi:hypothetical protein